MTNTQSTELVIPDYPFFIFNTETRRKEIFSSSTRVLMYTCGPTVYDYAHIGNFRTYIFEDVLKKSLEFFGKDVTQVMNITDVEDKTIAGAIKANVSLNDFTAPYIEAFFQDLVTLNISPATYYPRATHFIPEMIEAVQKLIDTGYAYISPDNSVYFSIKKSATYGRLIHLDQDHLQQSARIHEDEYEKESVGDFALWKAYDKERDGTVFWDSPFGKGRPGWHLECSIMATKLLGMNIDIHAGGVDNIFPHHENEIAQSEALFGGSFVRYWVHSEHLLINGKKMSKKTGNFFTLKDLLLKGYSGNEIRYMLLQSHYRSPLNFTEEAVFGCRSAIKKVNEFIARLVNIQATITATPLSPEVQQLVNTCMDHFSQAISNDLNIPEALACLFNMISPVNRLIDNNKIFSYEASFILSALKKINTVISTFSLDQYVELDDHLKYLLETREQARRNKEWVLADNIRKQLLEHHYIVEDTPQGPRLKKIS